MKRLCSFAYICTVTKRQLSFNWPDFYCNQKKFFLLAIPKSKFRDQHNRRMVLECKKTVSFGVFKRLSGVPGYSAGGTKFYGDTIPQLYAMSGNFFKGNLERYHQFTAIFHYHNLLLKIPQVPSGSVREIGPGK